MTWLVGTFASAISIIILNKTRTILIDGIICQMHKEIIDITFFCAHVLIRGKSSQSIIEEVNLEWINSIKENINSEIKF